MVTAFLVSGLLLAGNFFFVATEFAITRARPSQVAELADSGTAGAGSLRHAVEHLDAYLSACQLGITVCSIGLGIFAEPALHDLLEPALDAPAGLLGVGAAGLGLALSYFVVSTLHVVVGELTPKSLAIARTARTGLVLALPMRVFYLATKPIVDLYNWMGNVLLRPFGIPPASEAGHAPHSEAELRQLIRESHREGVIEPEERELAENVFTFGDRRAREVMVPRPEVRFLTTALSVEEAADRVRETGLTRLPLCAPEGELDDAIGVVHAKGLLDALRRGERDLRRIALPLRRVPSSLLIDDLLEELRGGREHLAVVVDEHGTAVGVITLEDVLEEIVGDIRDEFEADGEPPLRDDGEGRLRVRGDASARQVARRLEVKLRDVREATIGGHLVERLGRVPEPGERLDDELPGWRVEVVATDETRIAELSLERLRGDRRAGS